MASRSCWRCLLRAPSLSVRAFPGTKTILTTTAIRGAALLPRQHQHLFSTTSPTLGNPQLKKAKPIPKSQMPRRGEKKSLGIKKKNIPKASGRPPAPGERKAMRKRVVLSNTNALDPGIVDMTSVDTEGGREIVGTVLGLPTVVVDGLRAVEAFKPGQGWGLFRRPAVLVTEEAARIAEDMSKAEKGSKTVRRVWVGERGVGKSVMLLQAMTFAFLKGWVVVSLPEGRDLTNGHTAYALLRNTEPPQYFQKDYTSALLSRIIKANEEILSSLTLSLPHKDFPLPLQSNLALARLAEMGVRDPELAWPVFQALWTELTAPSSEPAKARPPIMLAADGLGHMMCNSAYRDSSFSFIHAHDLALVRLFVDYLSGARSLPNGGAVLAATSSSNTPSSPSLSLALAQRTGGTAVKDPFTKYDDRVLSALSDAVEIVQLKGLDRNQARALIEYFAKCGLVRAKVDEKFVTEKWTVAGCGVVGEIQKAAVMGARA